VSLIVARVELPESAPLRDGVILATDLGVLQSAHQRAQAILSRANATANALLEDARNAAESIRAQTQQELARDTSRLLGDIAREWDGIKHDLQPVVVAVARVALERLCAGASWQERVESAAALALRELPDKVVRISTAPGVPRPMLESATNAVHDRDERLPTHAVVLDDGAVSVLVDFDSAQASVDNDLIRWLNEKLPRATGSSSGAAIEGPDQEAPR
jgi:hypothetical protein